MGLDRYANNYSTAISIGKFSLTWGCFTLAAHQGRSLVET